MKHSFMSFMVAAAMLIPCAMPVEAGMPLWQMEENDTGIEQKAGIQTISENTSGQTFVLDQGKGLRIHGNGKKTITVSNCTFEMSGHTVSDADPDSREMKDYFKIFAGDNVVFDHCTFTSQGSQDSDSVSDSNLFLSGENIVFKDCSFASTHYEGRYFSAYTGTVALIDCAFDIQDQTKQPAFNITEADVEFDDTNISISGTDSSQPCFYANGQDKGSISLLNGTKLEIKDNKADAMQLNQTRIDVKNSRVLVQNNRSGILGGTWNVLSDSGLSSLDNEGLGMHLSRPMTISRSSFIVSGNKGTAGGYEDVDLYIDNTRCILKNVRNAALGRYVCTGTIDREGKTNIEGTELTEKKVSEDKSDETKNNTKTYRITIDYIDAQSEKKLFTYTIYNQPQGEKYDFKAQLEANVPQGYKLLSYAGDVSGTLDANKKIFVSVQPDSKYFVRINYVDMADKESIHPSNQLIGLDADSKWDVEKFGRIRIEGYEFVKCDHALKGDSLDKDITITSYYRRIVSPADPFNPKHLPIDPSVNEERGLFVMVGFIGLAAVILLIARHFSRKNDDDDDENEGITD